jgi:hypothetical protein
MGYDFNTFTQVGNLFSTLGANSRHEIQTVNSLEDVRNFTINRGDSYLLLDPNADLLYIKEMDSIGKISIKVFQLTDITEQQVVQQVNISKEEYGKLLDKINYIESMIGGNKNEVTKQSAK